MTPITRDVLPPPPGARGLDGRRCRSRRGDELSRLVLSLALLLLAASPARGQVSIPYAGPIEIAVGDTVHLEIDLQVSHLCRLKWTALDPSVATIGAGGVLAGVSPGATTLHVEASGDHEPCRGMAAIHVRVGERPLAGPVPRLDHTLVRRERRAILDRALEVVCGDPNLGSLPVYLNPVPLRARDPTARHPVDWLREAPGRTCVTGVAGKDEAISVPEWLRVSLSTPRFLYGGEVEVAYTLSGVLHAGPRGGFSSKTSVRLSRAADGWKVIETRLKSIT